MLTTGASATRSSSWAFPTDVGTQVLGPSPAASQGVSGRSGNPNQAETQTEAPYYGIRHPNQTRGCSSLGFSVSVSSSLPTGWCWLLISFLIFQRAILLTAEKEMFELHVGLFAFFSFSSVCLFLHIFLQLCCLVRKCIRSGF